MAKNKLKAIEVQEIRWRHKNTKIGYHCLAQEFGVTKGTIQAACNGRSWEKLEDKDFSGVNFEKRRQRRLKKIEKING